MANISKIKLKTGDQFHHWTVTAVHSAQKVDCTCSCGNTKQQRQTDLLRGTTKQCQECYAKKPRAGIHSGKRFGKWKIISVNDYEYLYRSNGKVLERKYKCECDCGTQKYIRTSHITRGLSKQCNSCRLNDYHTATIGDIPIATINRYKSGATRRKKEWELTNEFLWDLFKKQNKRCALSNIHISFSKTSLGTKNAKHDNTASLDRIDSERGYTPDNIQWLHKTVNKMKMDLDEKEFLNFAKLISEHQQK